MGTGKGFDWAGFIPAAAGAISNIFGIGEKRQDRRQLEQQGKLNEMDMANARKMREMQMQTWNETNYSAQMKHAKDAGLSMSIFGKGGGTSGATVGAPTTGTNSGTAADAASAMNAGTNQAMSAAQLALMGAQKENIEADTKNKEAGAGKATEETKGKIIENKVAGETQEEAMKKIRMDAENARNIMLQNHNKAIVGTATQQNEIEGLKAQYAGEAIENALKGTEIEKNKEEVKAIARRLIQKDEEIDIQKFNAEMDKAYPGITQVMGRTVNDTIQAIFDLFGKNRNQQKQEVKKTH